VIINDKDIDLNIVEQSGSEVKCNTNYGSKLEYSRTPSKPNSNVTINSVIYNEYSFAP
jgi:hypothetical protein